MKVETPQILWNSEGDSRKNAALMSVAMLSSSSLSDSSNHNILATAGHCSSIHLWQQQQQLQHEDEPTPPNHINNNNKENPITPGATTTSSSSNSMNMNPPNPLRFLCALTRLDSTSCNCVRFSPNGLHLAAAGERAVVVWSLPMHPPNPLFYEDADASNIHSNTATTMTMTMTLNSPPPPPHHSPQQPPPIIQQSIHPFILDRWSRIVREADLICSVAARNADAFMDICWSADSTRLFCGSIDHSVRVLDMTLAVSNNHNNTIHSSHHPSPSPTRNTPTTSNTTTTMMMNHTPATTTATTTMSVEWKTILRHDEYHAHFVQGVALDPLNVYLASMSSDRSVRIQGIVKKKPKQPDIISAGAGATTTTTTLSSGITSSSISSSSSGSPRSNSPRSNSSISSGKLDHMTRNKVIKYYRSTTSTNIAGVGNTITATTSTTSLQQEQDDKDNNKNSSSTSTHQRHLFHDEAGLESFVRRLAFTVDGAYLITPAALWPSTTSIIPPSMTKHNPITCGGVNNSDHSNMNHEMADATPNAMISTTTTNATLLFARHKWDEPCRVLVGLQKPSIAVRPCPILFQLPEALKENHYTLRGSGVNGTSTTPSSSHPPLYRSIFCVLTWDSVVIYDTLQSHPLAIVTGIHYCNLVDAAWSADGRTLLVCSTDGYVSIIRFDKGELGIPYIVPGSTQNDSIPTTTRRVVSSSSLPSPPSSQSQRLPPCDPGGTVLEAPCPKRAKISSTFMDTGISSSSTPTPTPVILSDSLTQMSLHDKSSSTIAAVTSSSSSAADDAAAEAAAAAFNGVPMPTHVVPTMIHHPPVKKKPRIHQPVDNSTPPTPTSTSTSLFLSTTT